MQNEVNSLFGLLILLLPSYVASQSSFGDEFIGNSNGELTPSNIIIIIFGIIFILTGFLAVFLRQFSQGCFGLNPSSSAPNVYGHPVALGLDAETINSHPTYLYSDVKQHRLGKVALECAVCLSEFQDPEVLRLLPGCSHVFHPRCIDPWLASHVTCPICRHNLEPVSGTTHKPHSHTIVNVPVHITPYHQSNSNGPDQAVQLFNIDERQSADHDDDDVEGRKKRLVVGKFPRSHSTGHSLADWERFTLRLPEDVQNRLVNRSGAYFGESLGSSSMFSPRSGYRCGWFSMTPPHVNARFDLVHSPTAAGLIISGSKNLPPPPVKPSDRLWPI